MDPLMILANVYIQLDKAYPTLTDDLKIWHQNLSGWFHAQATTTDMLVMRETYERAEARWNEAHEGEREDINDFGVSPIDILTGRDRRRTNDEPTNS